MKRTTRVPIPLWGRSIAFLIGMFLAAELSNALSIQHAFSTIWLPAGLFVAVLLTADRREWPALIAAAIVANVASDLLHDRALLTSLCFSVANSVESVAGALLVARFVTPHPRLRRQREALGFLTLAGIAAPVVGATLGMVIIKSVVGEADLWTTWYTWWIGDALGIVIVGSLTLTILGWWEVYRDDPALKPWQALRPVVVSLVIAVPTSVISYIVFTPMGGATSWKFLTSPGLLAFGVLGGPTGAAASFAIVALSGILGMVRGSSPAEIAAAGAAVRLFQAQAFFLVWGMSVVILAAVSVENRSLMQDAMDSADRFRMLFNSMREGVAHLSVVRNARGHAIDGVILEVNEAFPRLTRASDAVGRRVNEVFPDLRVSNPDIFSVFGEVALTGEPTEIEITVPPSERVLRFSVTSPRPEEALAVFDDATERAAAERELAETNRRLERMVYDVAEAMGTVVEARDPYTQGHQVRVAMLARLIGVEMGLGQDELDELGMAALLHDIGKLRVPAEILTKPGKLSNVEMDLIREHPEQGYETLKHIDFPWRVAEIVRQHHERMDGTGYPRCLRGDEILAPARILAAADVVEAIASYRPYRAAIGLSEGIEEICSNPEKYDADVSGACRRLYDRGVIDFTNL